MRTCIDRCRPTLVPIRSGSGALTSIAVTEMFPYLYSREVILSQVTLATKEYKGSYRVELFGVMTDC